MKRQISIVIFLFTFFYHASNKRRQHNRRKNTVREIQDFSEVSQYWDLDEQQIEEMRNIKKKNKMKNTKQKTTQQSTDGSKKSSRQKDKIKNKKKNKNKQKSHEHQYLQPDEISFWLNATLALFLACGGGFCSGMTVGLNSLNKLTLQIMKLQGTSEQKKMATRILNTISNHHLFLVTLLIGNAMVLQSLPIVVHTLMPDWAAILVSTFAVVIVAQIVPMSATTGPQKMNLAYLGAPLVDFMIRVFYIIAYPMSMFLDWLLGSHQSGKIKRRDFLSLINQRKKNQLKISEIIMFNQLFVGQEEQDNQNNQGQNSNNSSSSQKKVSNLRRVKYHTSQQGSITAEKIMVPLRDIFMVNIDDLITPQLLDRIMSASYSFLLIHTQNPEVKTQKINLNITSIVKMKEFTLKFLKLKKKLPASKFPPKVRDVLEIKEKQFLINPKKTFKKALLKEHQLHNQDDLFNYNNKNKLPVVYSDTGLIDLMGIFDLKSCRVALVHRQKRRSNSQGVTSIAYLDADDHIVYYDPFNESDRQQIIGFVLLSKVFQQAVDFQQKNMIIIEDLAQSESHISQQVFSQQSSHPQNIHVSFKPNQPSSSKFGLLHKRSLRGDQSFADIERAQPKAPVRRKLYKKASITYSFD